MSTTEIRPGGQLFSVMDHTLQMRAGLSQSVHFPVLAQGVSAPIRLAFSGAAFSRTRVMAWSSP
jgi:hypothetical protein